MSKSESLMNPAKAGMKQSSSAGFVWMIAAKVFFIVASYAIALLLPRWLGSVAEFGLFASALTLMSLVNNILTVSTIQSVSHFVSDDSCMPHVRLRQALKLQFWVGVILFGSFVALAKPISNFLNDDDLVPLLQTMPVIFFSYALYGAAAGFLNGQHAFSKQARLDVFSSTARTFGILAPAFIGWGALGSARGMAVSSMMVCTFAILTQGVGLGGPQLAWRKWFSFLVPMWVYFACINGALLSDLLVLKRTVSEMALVNGKTILEASNHANELAGFYKGAQTFALVPYQFMLSITLVVFPSVSKVSRMGDANAAKKVIQNALRFSLILLALIAAPILSAPKELLSIVYPDSFVVGAPALGVLVVGICFFGLFLVLASMLNSSGRPTVSALIAGGSWLLCVFLVKHSVASVYPALFSEKCTLSPLWGLTEMFNLFSKENFVAAPNAFVLSATAWGTTIASLFAFLLAAFFVRRKFGVLFPLQTVLRVLFSFGAAVFSIRQIPELPMLNGWLQLLFAPVLFALGLLATREITKSELLTIWKPLRNKFSGQVNE